MARMLGRIRKRPEDARDDSLLNDPARARRLQRRRESLTRMQQEGQAAEMEADREIAQGGLSPVFESADDMFHHLDAQSYAEQAASETAGEAAEHRRILRRRQPP